jgi:alpha-L-rhamnosidase
MISRSVPEQLTRYASSLVLALFLFQTPTHLCFAAAALKPTDLRCEYLREPSGIDRMCPRLSWILEAASADRGQFQTAYQVLVAASLENLKSDVPDLWDSGKVNSDASIQVAYAGSALKSAQECFWKVRVWDSRGRKSAWSEPARWSMGLLAPSDWKAIWIGRDEPETKPKFTGASWIWFPEGHAETAAPIATRFFRRLFQIPEGREIKSARWQATGDNEFTVFCNGEALGSGGNFKTVSDFDVRERLHPGKNVLAARVKNVGDQPNPAGLVGLLQIEFAQGDPLRIQTDDSWFSSATEFEGWEKASYDDSTWLAAQVLGPAGMEPWGEIVAAENRTLPARYLRKEFAIQKTVRRGTVWFSGLGLSELYLNGRKLGDHVLSPGLTEYTKRVFYVTHEVAQQLRSGKNAIGVVLGNGRFYAPRGAGTVSYGFPKLLFQMCLEYTDGSIDEVVSDGTWRLTTDGPIRANNEYDGEDYDARLEMPGWSSAEFDDSGWSNAQVVKAPDGQMSAQMIEPIRVTGTRMPVTVTEARPGVYIFDMGQNMVGWCRVRMAGQPGQTITLRHAETLKSDGTLYMDNIRSAKVTDHYTCKGQGTETYEPRFTYHGFRYVEVTGLSRKPSLDMLEGRVVNDDVALPGEFACSNQLLNQIYRNAFWGVRGNYRSMPTDCPQRDERQGWLGDRSAESKGETYLLNISALYAKWVQDMADAQKESGSVSDVCPAYWPIYSDNVTWPSSTVIIPGSLRLQYGDMRVIETHYASAKKWWDYMSGFITNGIIERDSYGDWCVPPEDPKLIHSNDPARKTDRALLATAYFYYDALVLADYAKWLCKYDDAREFTTRAGALKTAFNAKFYSKEKGYYSNGSQTSCVLPLAFGLVPEGERERVFNQLVEKITRETDNHIGTGLIGGQYLMRVLSDNGRPDLAYTIAAQSTYPSWGYMVKKGATTFWELWNGDTADPAMNSGNHVMLVGDFVIWCNEYLAGIRADEQQPGFKHIIMRPEIIEGLTSAKATHRSPFGLIGSDWKKSGAGFEWNITVPANTRATVYVPAPNPRLVRESGKTVSRAKGVKLIGTDGARCIYEVGSGKYQFNAGS